MTISDFKHYCKQKQPNTIMYNTQNDRERTEADKRASHLEALQLVLAFDSVIVASNPNQVFFKGDCGVMYVNNVKSVFVDGECMLGEIIRIAAGTSNGEREYTFIFR